MLGYYSFAKDINNTNELINKIEQQNGLNKILWCEKEWEMIPSKQECPNGGTITIGYTMNHYDCNSGCLI
ncbi:MAG: hypothetical protein LC122_02025, partial [Chitinophagales bacterium]|nr:hypothetical protein [Chitinophagales bacterium]